MKVAQIIPALGFGGAEREVARIGSLLFENGLNSEIICLYEAGHLATNLRLSGVNVIGLNMKRNTNIIFRFMNLRAFLEKEKYDIIHVHLVPWAVLAAKLAGSRAIFLSEHGYSMGNSPIYRFIEILFSRLCDRIIVVARDLIKVRQKERWFPSEKVVFIPNCVDTDRFKNLVNRREIRSRLNIPEEHFFILSVGRLYPVKGQTYLVQAAKQVIASYPKATFAIAGGGPLLNDLVAEASRYGLGDRFRLLGFRTDIETLLRAADIFVLPSLKEGTSIAILEAMSAGIPVVATDVGGNPELIEDGETGLLVRPKDPYHLADAILKMIQNPLLRTRSVHNAQKKIQSEYSQNENIKKLINLYYQSIG